MKPYVFRTTDLSLSAFLRTKGHRLLSMERDQNKGVFVFADTQELREDVLRWGNDTPVLLAARVFINTLRDLKGMVSR
jgi:hypothetical protein